MSANTGVGETRRNIQAYAEAQEFKSILRFFRY